ncbi:hypothetical protein QWJ26_22955 [Streptomyces sp. CSDS2]|uniref:hypothetical protein n=1 Tax=Streptomyces sp. CSDS2 TaxID=3055051 RepID=UPI0025B1BE57|nr:hypothetical protein [Streptomyces sp. CSDS2]MDN3262611.1 hypothetical protein [Streptomyces sp. CSDS2]
MPADEVTRGSDVDGARARTGPRHAAPRKPLFTRFHMPAGKAIASVAMPTAVLMGMGFTSTLALADNNGNASSSPSAPPSASAKDLTREEYEACVKALDEDKDQEKDTSQAPSPEKTTASGKEGESEKTRDKGGASSSDSGSDDEATPGPTAPSDSASAAPDAGNSGSSGTSSRSSASDSGTAGSGSGSGGDADASAKTRDGNLLDTIGDTIGDILSGGRDKDTGTSEDAPDPAPTASRSPKAEDSGTDSGGAAVENTADDTAGNKAKAADDTTGTGAKAGEEDAAEPDGEATPTPSSTPSSGPSGTPSPSGSESASVEDCPVATDEEGGVDNTVAVADDPWYLDASSLLLKGADYQGIVEVRRANGTTKKVLKYVISDGTEIGDLHQTVKDKQANKTYHVQAAKGSKSTITGGDTVMYTESISGNLFGLLPVTFSPDSPPPLNIPLIYFTHVKVVQAAQFGGNLHIPGMRMYMTD